MNIDKNNQVLIVTNHYHPENFKVNDIARSLSKQINTHVVTQRPNYPTGKFYSGFDKLLTVDNKLSVYRLPVFPRRNGKVIYILFNYISYFISLSLFFIFLILTNKKYTHIIVHHTSPPLLSIPPIIYKLIKPKTKLIFWELDLWPESLRALKNIHNSLLFKSIENTMVRIYGFYSTILIGSRSYKEILQIRAQKSTIEYFPSWAESIYENLHDTEIEKVYLPEGFNIIYAGNIGTVQNLHIVPEIIEGTKDVNFILLGDGKFAKELREMCEKKGILDRVFFLGYKTIHDVRNYIYAADITYLSLMDIPIFEKTVPAKLQMYMAMGKPVLGVLAGEGKSLIDNCNCGITVSPGNNAEIIKAVEKLKGLSMDKLKILGENGKAFYNYNFRFDLRLNQLMDTLERQYQSFK